MDDVAAVMADNEPVICISVVVFDEEPVGTKVDVIPVKLPPSP